MIRFATLPLLSAGMLLLPGCGSQAAPAEQQPQAAVAESPHAGAAGDNAGLKTIDPAPENGDTSRIAGKQDVEVEGKPACAFSVQYADAVPQPVTWRSEPCSALTAEFLSQKELSDMGKMDGLSAEAKADVERSPKQTVFYVEGEFTASIYPLNVAGRVYEVPVAD